MADEELTEVGRRQLMHTEPPEGVQITVSMRALWRALNGFGFDDPRQSQVDAFEALWSQIAAERPDARG
jgi:hypothetical protein